MEQKPLNIYNPKLGDTATGKDGSTHTYQSYWHLLIEFCNLDEANNFIRLNKVQRVKHLSNTSNKYNPVGSLVYCQEKLYIKRTKWIVTDIPPELK